MKTVLKSTLLASILVLGTTNLYSAQAGIEHSHGGSTHVHEKINEAKAIEIAKSMKNGLAKKGTIDNTWTNIDVLKIEKKRFGKNDEWVVNFKNSNMEEKKQILYVFISLTGEVTGANFTGN
jgi:hypothetical protein